MTPRQPTVGMENGHGHAHFWERALSRGVFIKAAGATGAVIGADVLLPGLVSAASHTNPTPKPIPGGFSVNGSLFHVLGGPGSEPSSITDFNGNVGIAFIRGTGTGTDTGTGATNRLLFDSDMRFMTGKYRAVDGKQYHGTFGFVWLDLYTDQVDPFAPDTHQIHDFDPGIAPFPSGLFWTIPLRSSSVDVDMEDASASYGAANVPLRDFGTLLNAFLNRPSVPGVASFNVEWHMLEAADTRSLTIRDTAQGYAGTFWQSSMAGAATLEWTASENGFTFVSDAASTSSSLFAELGRERNGVYFPQGESNAESVNTVYARLRAEG